MPTNYWNPYNPYVNGSTSTGSSSPFKPGIIWVQGVEGAKAYQVQPNGAVVLMDSENEGTFYIKTTDSIGISTLRTFKYEEVVNKPASPEYVTMTQLEEMMAKLKEELTSE